jgi:hypothetical protein
MLNLDARARSVAVGGMTTVTPAIVSVLSPVLSWLSAGSTYHQQ